MAIPPFSTLTSRAMPLEAENTDTDQIIPARFLKNPERKGFGENLFRDPGSTPRVARSPRSR